MVLLLCLARSHFRSSDILDGIQLRKKNLDRVEYILEDGRIRSEETKARLEARNTKHIT